MIKLTEAGSMCRTLIDNELVIKDVYRAEILYFAYEGVTWRDVICNRRLVRILCERARARVVCIYQQIGSLCNPRASVYSYSWRNYVRRFRSTVKNSQNGARYLLRTCVNGVVIASCDWWMSSNSESMRTLLGYWRHERSARVEQAENMSWMTHVNSGWFGASDFVRIFDLAAAMTVQEEAGKGCTRRGNAWMYGWHHCCWVKRCPGGRDHWKWQQSPATTHLCVYVLGCHHGNRSKTVMMRRKLTTRTTKLNISRSCPYNASDE